MKDSVLDGCGVPKRKSSRCFDVELPENSELPEIVYMDEPKSWRCSDVELPEKLPEIAYMDVRNTVKEPGCCPLQAELGEQEMKDSCCSELVVLSCAATLNLSGSLNLKECYHSDLVVLEYSHREWELRLPETQT